MAITNLPTELTSAGNTGTAGDYSSAGTSVFQISYANIGYVPSTINVYENDFGAELRVFINGVRIYRLSSDTVGTDTSLTTAQKNRLDALNTSYGNQPWTIDSTNSRIQINKDHTVWGDTHTDNCGYPALSAWTIIKVVRIKSDKTTLTTDFQNASVLTEKQLDNAFLETFHIAQEAFDKTASGSLNKDTDDVWDANTTRIKNVSDPVNDQDVATKAWVNSNANTTTVAGSIANVNHVAGQISPTNNISTVATSVTAGHIATVAGDAADIGAVATREAEIGRLGTAEAVADMAILGTTDVVADMAILATTDVVADMNTLGTADVVADMNTLATADVVADMNTLGTADVVSDMNTLATTDNVSNMDTVATNITNVNNVGSNISSVNSVATNISQVTTFSDTYHTAGTTEPSGSNVTEGDLWFDTANDVLKVYDGSSWGSASSSIATVASQNEFTASDGQGTDNKYFALVHDVGLELVFLNGVRLKRGSDYYCTNSNTSTTAIASGNAATFVRLETVPSTNDILSVMAFGQIANNLAVNTAGGTFTGAVTFEGQNTHNTGSNTFTMPTTRGTDGYVLTRDDSVDSSSGIGTTWKQTALAPTIASIKYSEQTSGTFVENTGQTATEASASTPELCQLIGANFAAGMTISVAGTSAGSVVINSSTEATFTPPSKSAGSYTLTATNTTGLSATITIAYDTDPAWVTGANADLGDFIDGSITGTNGPQIIASESGSNLTTGYKQVTSNTDNTVITSGIAGLTIGDNGYLTGTLAGTEGATNNFYAIAVDNEGQQSAIRQFHFVSYDYIANSSSGNTVTNYTYGGTTYRIHVFTADGTFTTYASGTYDFLLVGGGGGGSFGGGGAGRLLWATSQTIASGSHTINVGVGGAGSATASGGRTGEPSSIGTLASPLFIAIGGGAGGGSSNTGGTNDGNAGEGSNGGSGGGGGHGSSSLNENGGVATLGGSGNYDYEGTTYTTSSGANITSYGENGSNGSPNGNTYWGGGGGGSAQAGQTGSSNDGGDGGDGSSTFVGDAASTAAFLWAAQAGTNASNASTSGLSSNPGTLYIAGGGAGAYGNSPGGTGGGGQSYTTTTTGQVGMANTGSGAGGANTYGGAGGSGIVIIRYAI